MFLSPLLGSHPDQSLPLHPRALFAPSTAHHYPWGPDIGHAPCHHTTTPPNSVTARARAASARHPWSWLACSLLCGLCQMISRTKVCARARATSPKSWTDVAGTYHAPVPTTPHPLLRLSPRVRQGPRVKGQGTGEAVGRRYASTRGTSTTYVCNTCSMAT